VKITWGQVWTVCWMLERGPARALCANGLCFLGRHSNSASYRAYYAMHFRYSLDIASYKACCITYSFLN
jgi:hypothetical protein